MEFARSASQNFYKKDDPYYPCDDLEANFGPKYSFSCGRNQATLLMSRFHLSFDDVIKVCLNSTSEQFKKACVDSLGFYIAASGDPKQIISGCRQISDPNYLAACTKAAAGELIFQEIPGWGDKSTMVCQSLQNPDECLKYLETIIKEYGRQKKNNFSSVEIGQDKNAYLRDQLNICYGSGGRDNCYKRVAKVLYDQFGLSKTMSLLRENEDYQEVFARCHEVTHYLSRLEFEKLNNISGVYSQCDSTCHGGCYHGTIEAYLKSQNLETEASLAAQFPKICGKLEDYTKPLEYYECLHGLGHAAMFVTDMELKESLRLCDALESQIHKEKCYTGVFMENSSSSTSLDHATVYLKKDDPFYPCNILEEKYLALCWQYQSSYFAILNHQDFAKVARMCFKIPEKFQDNCIRTIGTNQVGFTKDFALMKTNCESMLSLHFQSVCIGGVISSLSYRFVGKTNKMIDFCSNLSSIHQESCFKQIGTSLLDWDSDKNFAKNECKKIQNQKQQTWCLSVV